MIIGATVIEHQVPILCEIGTCLIQVGFGTSTKASYSHRIFDENTVIRVGLINSVSRLNGKQLTTHPGAW